MRRNAVDLDRLSHGQIEVRPQDQLIGYVGASGREYILDEDDFRVLAQTSPVDWEDAARVADRGRVEARVIELLVEYGFLVSDQGDRAVSRALALWDEDALYFHQRMKWEGQDAGLPPVSEDPEESRAASEAWFEALTAQLGEIPGHFHRRSATAPRVELSEGLHRSPLTELLGKRCTTRHFDTEVALGLEAFSVVLRQVFGCRGTARLAREVVALKKSSPSGGAMHPVEVYPLALRVEGLEPGLYHYNVGDHALEPLRLCSEEDGREMARLFTAGQGYFALAQVLLLYTARYERSFWKYRRNPRAYRVVQLDLGHLSQTLYLMCADLGLGAFFTAACNEVDIEKALGIDGIAEGAVAIGGLGIPASGLPMGLQAVPHTPQRD